MGALNGAAARADLRVRNTRRGNPIWRNIFGQGNQGDLFDAQSCHAAVWTSFAVAQPASSRMSDALKVQFEFSARDLAEVASRSAARSRLIRQWRWQSEVLLIACLGVVVYAITPLGPGDSAIFAALFCAIMLLIGRLFPRNARADGRFLKYYRDKLGGDGPFLCEVELTAESLTTRQLGVESRHPWSHIVSVRETAIGIEFIYSPMGELLVRERAFASPQARAEFLQFAQRHMTAIGK